MGRKRNESGHLGRKKMKILGTPHSKFYVVDVDHLEDTSTIHPIDIRSLNSIYPTIGKTIESIYHVDDKRITIYPPIGKRGTLQSRKKRVELKSTSVYPPLTKKGIFEIKVGRYGLAGAKKRAVVSTTEELLDKVAKLTGKTISPTLRGKIVGSIYPPVGIAIVEKGNLIKIINNDGRE